MIPWLRGCDPFPPIELALREPNGLLAAGGSLTTERLVDAYSRGIFPWSSEGQPILWWSPDPRMVLFTDRLVVARSLRKRVRSRFFEVRLDTACAEVIAACSQPRADQDGTWITEEMREAYLALHRQGYVHSVESWRNDELVGGLYGVALDRMFFGESMFTRENDASKVALVYLAAHLRRLDVPMIDCQQETAHLASLGAHPVPRTVFAEYLAQLIHSLAPPAGWTPGALAAPEL